jgi:hypothetical protein
VLGPWVNRSWLNVLAGLIVGVLLLSGILMATTLFPGIDVIAVTGYLALVVLAAAAIAILRWSTNRQPKSTGPEPLSHARAGVDPNSWRMPPLTLLQPVRWSASTRLGMLALRGYLIVGAVLLVVKAINSATDDRSRQGGPRPRASLSRLGWPRQWRGCVRQGRTDKRFAYLAIKTPRKALDWLSAIGFSVIRSRLGDNDVVDHAEVRRGHAVVSTCSQE